LLKGLSKEKKKKGIGKDRRVLVLINKARKIQRSQLLRKLERELLKKVRVVKVKAKVNVVLLLMPLAQHLLHPLQNQNSQKPKD